MNENEKTLTNDELKEVNGGKLPYDPNELLKPIKPEYKKKENISENELKNVTGGFEGSQNLTPAPELPPQTLAGETYNGMNNGK